MFIFRPFSETGLDGRVGLSHGVRHCARIAVLVAAAVTSVPVRAHDPGISTVQGRVAAGKIELVNGFAPADVELLLPERLRTGEKWTETEFESARGDLEKLAQALWVARAHGTSAPFRLLKVELAPGDAVNFYLEAVVPAGGKFTLQALKLGALPTAHRQFVIISDEQGSTVAKKLLSNRDTDLEVVVTSRATERPRK